jgi:hypothetical protein
MIHIDNILDLPGVCSWSRYRLLFLSSADETDCCRKRGVNRSLSSDRERGSLVRVRSRAQRYHLLPKTLDRGGNL